MILGHFHSKATGHWPCVPYLLTQKCIRQKHKKHLMKFYLFIQVLHNFMGHKLLFHDSFLQNKSNISKILAKLITICRCFHWIAWNAFTRFISDLRLCVFTNGCYVILFDYLKIKIHLPSFFHHQLHANITCHFHWSVNWSHDCITIKKCFHETLNLLMDTCAHESIKTFSSFLRGFFQIHCEFVSITIFYCHI